MGQNKFTNILEEELARLDRAGVTKRSEKIIEKFAGTKAVIDRKEVTIFNSNDYLGLRLNPEIKCAEGEASEKYGAGPGAVRFISGTLKIYRELEEELAKFH